MLEQSLQDKIDVYLKPDYMEVVENACELWEPKDEGRTRLIVHLPADTSILCIRDHDGKPRCNFLNPQAAYGLKKSVDHILLTPKTDGKWTVHLVEMKTSINREEWRDIGLKARATILNMRAVAAILNIQIDSFKVYTTYEQVRHQVDDPTNMVGRKPRLGGGWKEDEWDKDKLLIYIPRGKEAYLRHNGVKMEREIIDGKSTLCGELSLA